MYTSLIINDSKFLFLSLILLFDRFLKNIDLSCGENLSGNSLFFLFFWHFQLPVIHTHILILYMHIYLSIYLSIYLYIIYIYICPPDNIPPDNIPRTISPRTISSQDKIPPDNIPPFQYPPGQYPPGQYPPEFFFLNSSVLNYPKLCAGKKIQLKKKLQCFKLF